MSDKSKGSSHSNAKKNHSVSPKESQHIEIPQPSVNSPNPTLLASAGVNVPSRPPPLSKSAQSAPPATIYSTPPIFLIPSLATVNLQYGLPHDLRPLPSLNSSEPFSALPLAGSELEASQARVESGEHGEGPANASLLPASVSNDF